MNGGVKKVINNGVFIATLAPLLPPSKEADDLVEAAEAYRDLLAGFGIGASAENFNGCDQAQTLLKWIRGEASPDAATMREWTAAIWSAIDDLAHGKMP